MMVGSVHYDAGAVIDMADERAQTECERNRAIKVRPAPQAVTATLPQGKPTTERLERALKPRRPERREVVQIGAPETEESPPPAA